MKHLTPLILNRYDRMSDIDHHEERKRKRRILLQWSRYNEDQMMKARKTPGWGRYLAKEKEAMNSVTEKITYDDIVNLMEFAERREVEDEGSR